MLLVGVALIVVIFFLRENQDDIPFGFSDTVVGIGVTAGVLVIIVSFMGCVGVCYILPMYIFIGILALSTINYSGKYTF